MPKETLSGSQENPNQESKTLFTAEINPVRARIIAATFDPNLIQPEKTLDPARAEAFKRHMGTVTGEALDFSVLDERSTQDRKVFAQDKNFDEYNKEWNSEIWNFVQYNGPDREEALKAFSSLGLNVQNQTSTPNGLNEEVEKFRKKYFPGDSRVKRFVTDIAEGCEKEGVFSIEVFESRLNAISGLLGIFGSDVTVQQLVRDFAASFAILSQEKEAKQAQVETILPFLQQPITGDNQTILTGIIPVKGPSPYLPKPRAASPLDTTTDSQDRAYGVGDMTGNRGGWDRMANDLHELVQIERAEHDHEFFGDHERGDDNDHELEWGGGDEWGGDSGGGNDGPDLT